MVTVDSALDLFYQGVNDYWYHHSNTTLGHVTVVSTGGGYRDYQVRSGLTSLDDVMHNLLIFLFSFLIFPPSINMFCFGFVCVYSFTGHLNKYWC